VRSAHNRSVSSDPFVSPLAKIKEEHKTANRAKHLRKAVPADTVDSLDGSFFGNGTYHHEGPYDATLASRQIPGYAPIDAVKYTNAQALAATPRANIIDSLTRKVPLQGVGMVPSGVVGPGGQRFDYEEEDIQRSQGRLGRWPGVVGSILPITPLNPANALPRYRNIWIRISKAKESRASLLKSKRRP